MRIIANITKGFNKKPFERILVLKLDLTSAFSHVGHTKLLEIIMNLGLPACYVKFYKGFLTDQRFYVKYNNTLSKSTKESCNSLQGIVSLPWLFLIYMEDLL